MENQLTLMVRSSGLEKSKAQVLLDKFSTYFEITSEWEKKAKAIVVTDASQEADMQMARVGRLFLRQKRIAIEHTRKELKEQSLREGKAIDGISNILKALIIPIEEHLEKQERYVEIKAAEEAARKRIEEEKKAEEERIALEKAEAEELRKEADKEAKERERIRKENEKLKKEAEEREREREKERTEARRALKALEEKAKKEKEDGETEREKREKAFAHKKRLSEEKLKKEKEAKEEAERKTKLAQARFRELQTEREKANLIKCPFCHKSFELEQGKE